MLSSASSSALGVMHGNTQRRTADPRAALGDANRLASHGRNPKGRETRRAEMAAVGGVGAAVEGVARRTPPTRVVQAGAAGAVEAQS